MLSRLWPGLQGSNKASMSKRIHVTDGKVTSHDLVIYALVPDNFRRRVEAESEGQEKQASLEKRKLLRHPIHWINLLRCLTNFYLSIEACRLFYLTVLKAVAAQNLHPLMPSSRLFSF